VRHRHEVRGLDPTGAAERDVLADERRLQDLRDAREALDACTLRLLRTAE